MKMLTVFLWQFVHFSLFLSLGHFSLFLFLSLGHFSLFCLVSCMRIDCEDHSSVFE